MNLLNIFLQIQMTGTAAADSTGAAGAGGQGATEKSMDLLKIMMDSKWVMAPIVLLSIIALYIIIERFITINRASQGVGNLMDKVRNLIVKGDVNGAKQLCENTDSPVARMLEKGIMRLGRPLKDIESSIEATGKIEIYKLEKNISILGIISGIAPMFGFVGTISGVIKIFFEIASNKGVISLEAVSHGLYEKMFSSAAGLIVGIIAHVGYHYLNLMVERVVYKMESNALEFVDLLQEENK